MHHGFTEQAVDRLQILAESIEFAQSLLDAAWGDRAFHKTRVARHIFESGAALGPGSEAVIVPGNHDHHLAAEWLARRARDAEPLQLGLESAVDWEPG